MEGSPKAEREAKKGLTLQDTRRSFGRKIEGLCRALPRRYGLSLNPMNKSVSLVYSSVPLLIFHTQLLSFLAIGYHRRPAPFGRRRSNRCNWSRSKPLPNFRSLPVTVEESVARHRLMIPAFCRFLRFLPLSRPATASATPLPGNRRSDDSTTAHRGRPAR